MGAAVDVYVDADIDIDVDVIVDVVLHVDKNISSLNVHISSKYSFTCRLYMHNRGSDLFVICHCGSHGYHWGGWNAGAQQGHYHCDCCWCCNSAGA